MNLASSVSKLHSVSKLGYAVVFIENRGVHFFDKFIMKKKKPLPGGKLENQSSSCISLYNIGEIILGDYTIQSQFVV